MHLGQRIIFSLVKVQFFKVRNILLNHICPPIFMKNVRAIKAKFNINKV